MVQQWRYIRLLFLLLRVVVAAAQVRGQALPYLKQYTLNGPAGTAAQSLHAAPDGSFLITFNPATSGYDAPAGFVRISAAGAVLESHGFLSGLGGGNKMLDLQELPDGRKLCVVQRYVQLPGAGGRRPHNFLKMLAPDLREIWSLALAEGRAYNSSQPIVAIAPDGSIFGISERFFYTATSFRILHLVFKVTPEGKLAWCKETGWDITDMAIEKDGTPILTCTHFEEDGSLILRLDGQGNVAELHRIPFFAARDLELFPNGDLFLSGYDPTIEAGKVIMRLTPDFQKKAVRRLSRRSYPFEVRNMCLLGDDLLYYFIDPPDQEYGRVLLRMDGGLNIQKAVFLPKESGLGVQPVPLGSGFVSASAVDPRDFSLTLLHLDSSMILPGACPVPPYCYQTEPEDVTFNNSGSIQFLNFVPEVVDATPEWDTFNFIQTDFCFDYEQPRADFYLPDTVCQGAVLLPGDLKQATALSWDWFFEGGLPETADISNPQVMFRTPGRLRVSQKIRFLGCGADTHERFITVLPRASVDLGPDTTLCTGQILTLPIASQGAVRWRWDDPGAALQRNISTNGLYYLEVSNGSCAAADTVRVFFGEADAGFDAPDSLCLGDTLALKPMDKTPGGHHHWSSDPSLFPSTAVTQPQNIIPKQSGLFALRHRVEYGSCSDETTQNIQVIPAPEVDLGPDRVVCTDSALVLQPLLQHASTYWWQDGFRAPVRTIQAPGLFTLSAYNGACLRTDTLILQSQSCVPVAYYAPNAFAPDSETDNAVFSISYNDSVERITLLEIYDRWGSLVYRTERNQGWDGRIQGKYAAPGVYLYRATLLLTEGRYQVVMGEISLIR